MRINKFFAEILGAPLHNTRQSWGAYKKETNQVYLRIGRWSIDDYTDGKRWAIVMDPEGSKWSMSYGGKERRRHLDLIRSGAGGFVIVVDNNNAGKISWFDDKNLFRIGNIVEEDGTTYAEILGPETVEQVLGRVSDSNPINRDIAEIYSQNIPETIRQQLVNARLGQGKFRKDLLKLWDDRCAVTGISLTEAIRASHIKPWKDSSHEERLDPYNGLPLVATLDALFDAGLITFNSAGEIQVSSQLRSKERKLLSLERLYLLRTPPKKTCEYLSHHMKHKFRQ